VPKKILCPVHVERTPSCNLYPDGWHCYGCGARGKLDELKGVDISNIREVEPEDLEASLAAIESLPKRMVRGLELHCDERSFYVVWPTRDYYKRRFVNPGKGPKYIGAAGHTMPPFIAHIGTSRDLIVVEGELNALSLIQAYPEATIVSPGGSGHFEGKHTRKWLNRLVQQCIIERIIVIADEDIAGAKAAIDLMSEVRHTNKTLLWKLMKRDANQVLQEDGRDALRTQILEILQSPVDPGA
jgi:hypothetical protein